MKSGVFGYFNGEKRAMPRRKKRISTTERSVMWGGWLLLLAGAIGLLSSGPGSHFAPMPVDHHEAEARVTGKMRRGSFMNPSFSLALHYDSNPASDERLMINARRVVDFETYQAMALGDVVPIYFDAHDPTQWYFAATRRTADEIAPALALVLLGGLLSTLPMVARLASRQDDFGDQHT